MKILLFCSTEFPHVGGLAVHMETLGKAFRKLGHEVDFLSVSNLPPVALILHQKSSVLVRRLLGSCFWVIFNLYFSRFLLGLLVRNFHKKNRYDVIQTQDPVSYTSTLMIRLLTHVPVFLTIHGYFAYEYVAGRVRKGSFVWILLQRWECSASMSARMVFTVDEGLKRYLVELGNDKNNISIMRNFVDVDEYKPKVQQESYREEFGLPDGKLVILCPRRLTEKCGVIYAAHAAKQLKESLKDNFLLVYAGDGPEREKILEYANENRLAQNIIVLGKVPHTQMVRLYYCADVVVIPSIVVGVEQEATSISVLEAMATGVPVIASNIGGLKELIEDGQNGYLVPEKDPKALALAIQMVTTKPQDKIIKKAREIVIMEYSHLSRARHFLESYVKV